MAEESEKTEAAEAAPAGDEAEKKEADAKPEGESPKEEVAPSGDAPKEGAEEPKKEGDGEAAPSGDAAPSDEPPKKKKKVVKRKRKKKKKKKKKKIPKPPLKDRLKALYRRVSGALKEMLFSLWAKDYKTRFMALVFHVSVVGILVISIVGGKRYLDWKALQKEKQTQAQMREAQVKAILGEPAHPKKTKYSKLDMGGFTFELTRPQGKKRTGPNTYLAQVQVVFFCKDKETRNYIKENMQQARDRVTSVFVRVSREDILNQKGKERIKKAIRDRINFWLPKEMTVVDVFFPSLFAG